MTTISEGLLRDEIKDLKHQVKEFYKAYEEKTKDINIDLKPIKEYLEQVSQEQNKYEKFSDEGSKLNSLWLDVYEVKEGVRAKQTLAFYECLGKSAPLKTKAAESELQLLDLED